MRSRFQIHLSTAVVLMLLASALLSIEIVFFSSMKSALESALASLLHADAVSGNDSALIFLLIIADIALLGFTAAVMEYAIQRREN